MTLTRSYALTFSAFPLASTFPLGFGGVRAANALSAADGPAVFIMLIAGFVVLGAALYVEIAYEPPIWLHLMIWLPLAVIICLALLRPMKGLAVALQYANKAEEGRRDK